MSIKEKALSVKAHVIEHKKFYIGVGTGVVIGIVVGVIIKSRPTQIINTVAPVFNNDNSSSSTLGGHQRKIVKCNETNDIFETLQEAADSAGVHQSIMSRHVNGHQEHIYGKTYSIIGLGTTS